MTRRAVCFLLACTVTRVCCAQTTEDCDRLIEIEDSRTLIVWNSDGPVLSRFGADAEWQTKFGQLRVVAVIEGGRILEPRNAPLRQGQSLWSISGEERQIVLNEIVPLHYVVREDESYCLFSAQSDSNAVGENVLLSNDPTFRLRTPGMTEQAMFDSNIAPASACANRAGMFLRDTPPEEIPPCKIPLLIGMSDIDGDRHPEYWATEILRYSTGIAVWEHDGQRFSKVHSACPLCGD